MRTIVPRQQQAKGQFNGGEILEKKPIGFRQDGGIIKPYSNLFYWAHAWSDEGSTIGLHPHQGFEILSFVLTGRLEHYDNKMEAWKMLDTGSVQIIRAGNGISHAERVLPDSSFFQIWFDPDLKKTINMPASYDDYPAEMFPWHSENGHQVKVFSASGNPVEMSSEGVDIFQLEFPEGGRSERSIRNRVASIFVLEGRIMFDGDEGGSRFSGDAGSSRFSGDAGSSWFSGDAGSSRFSGDAGSSRFSGDAGSSRFNGDAGRRHSEPGREQATKNDFVILEQEKKWSFETEAGTQLFVITTPARPSYPTYAEKYIR